MNTDLFKQRHEYLYKKAYLNQNEIKSVIKMEEFNNAQQVLKFGEALSERWLSKFLCETFYNNCKSLIDTPNNL